MTKTYAIDAATGQAGLRDMTEAEKSHFDQMQIQSNLLIEKKTEIEGEKSALLKKLGITNDEARLLLS
jgi:hypothetical protein